MVRLDKGDLAFNVNGDGKKLHTVSIGNPSIPYEFFKLKIEESKKGFPLELSSIKVNLGIVKAKFDKKSKKEK